MRIGIASVLGLFVLMATSSSANEEFVSAVAGYSANLDRFKEFKAQYTVTDCKCQTISDMLSGVAVTRSEAHVADWLVKGRLERFVVRTAKAVKDPTAPDSGHLTANSIFDGKLALKLGTRLPVAKLVHHVERADPKEIGTPLSFGHLYRGCDLRSIAQRCVRNEWYAKFNGVIEVAGAKTLAFDVGVPPEKAVEDYEKLVLRVFLDPERGFLPVKFQQIRSSDNIVECVGLITNAKEYSGNRWFPERSVFFLGAGKNVKGDFGFREFQVVQFEPDYSGKDSDFGLTIPGNYQLQLAGNNYALIQTAEDRRVSAIELPKLLHELIESGKQHKEWREEYDAFLTSESRTSRVGLAVLFGTGIVLVVFGFRVWRQRRLGASAQANGKKVMP
jgi:hypothetical protein